MKRKPSPATSQLEAFFELTKPRITFLILVSTALGFYLGSQGKINSNQFAFTMVGTFLLAGGAGAINHFVEKDLDKLMDRTQSRPIPAGIISGKNALFFGVSITIIGFIILAALVNHLTAILGLITVLLYIFIYTPLKRYSTLNTIVGAIPGALPPIGGWFAATSETSSIVTALFGIMFCWQIPHFLSLAYMYSQDYKKGGFIMLPSLYSNQVQTRVHIVFFTLCLIFITFSLYYNEAVGNIYLLGNIFLSLLFIYYVSKFTFSVNQKTAKGLFFASILYLPVLLVLVIINS